ncbi:MAG TPA: 4a-hydroxytetrahydrobiopterin dehydratase [Gammaproteobacteria bacterium]|nr:4a-hydroxytetrahydrobiopterin dehydratase [Gammaproteobacteria bacterium]
MTELAEKHCVPCEGGVQPLTREEAQRYLDRITPEWTLSDDAKTISKDFKFKGFNKTMGFVNAIAWIANSEGHHPDLEVGYGHCNVNFTTHAVGGLSENDFICAAKIDKLLAK